MARSTPPPKVVIDVTALPADRGGVGRYVEGLVGGLEQVGGVDITLVCKRGDVDRLASLAPSARLRTGPAMLDHRPARLAWEQTALPGIVRQVGANVLHCPHYTMPIRVDRPVVVTVHDLTFFSDPGVHLATKRVFFRRAIRTAVRRAARLIVPSSATRDELVQRAGGDPGRIDVALHGFDPKVFHRPDADETARVARKLGLNGPYIAFLGTLEPRKNAAALVRAWAKVITERDDPPALVLAGNQGWDDEVGPAVAEVPAHGRLLRPGYLPIEDLSGFLGGAAAVVYPSRGEGFGLPVLEAMACGAPVLTTRRLSLPEIGGDAVAYTEPDADSIAAELVALLDDPVRRADLGQRGISRARGFTWNTCAQIHAASYERAIAEARPQ